jgi:DNA-binding CsgD family transcriptional regulator/tetratricopeptide (TPR) repeat protein
LGLLETALEKASAGDPGLVLICGEAGVGKSRLLLRFADIAGQSGALLTKGICIELAAGALAYSPMVGALGGLADHVDPATREWLAEPARAPLRRLVPELNLPNEPLGAALDADSRSILFESASALLSRLSGERTVALFIEDLQWADRSTLDLLRYVTIATRKGRLLLVATVRTDDAAPEVERALAELGRDQRVQRIDLPRFSWSETGSLIEGIVGVSPSIALLNRVFERSEGNPFFAEELIAAGADGAGVTPGLRQVALGRVKELSEASQRLIWVVAAAGRPLDHPALRALSDLPDEDLFAGLQEAVRGYVLVPDGDTECYSFRHTLVREVVYKDILPGERQRLHRILAIWLQGEGPIDPSGLAEVALHFDRGRSWRAAVAAYVVAGIAAEAVSAYPEAFTHFDRALALVPSALHQAGDGPALPETEWLREVTARMAYIVGKPARAVELIKVSLAAVDRTGDPARAALLLERLGYYAHSAGDYSLFRSALEEAVALVRGVRPSPASARVFTSAARMTSVLGMWDRALPAALEAVEFARAVGARAEEGRALGYLGLARARLDLEAGLEDMHEAIEIARQEGNIESLIQHHTGVAAALYMAGDYPRLARAVQDAIEEVDRMGGALPVSVLLLADQAQMCVDSADWATAEAVLARAIGLTGQGTEHAEARFAAARLAAARGLAHEAAENLDFCWPFDKDVLPERHWAVRSELLVDDRRWVETRALVAVRLPACHSLSAAAYMIESGMRAEAELAAIARLHRDEAGVAEAVAHAGRMAARLDDFASSPHFLPLAWYQYARSFHAAEMSRIQSRPDPPVWRGVIDIAETAGIHFRAIYPRVRLAEALLETGARAEAATELRNAHSIAARIGARPLLEIIVALATRARISLDKPSEHASGSTAPDASTAQAVLAHLGLSPREVEVLAVLAEGRTNRQIAEALFISEKTTAIHVSRILDKLGAANRVEAAGVAHRLGLNRPATQQSDA